MAPFLLFKSLIFSQFLLLVIAHVEKCPSSFACGHLGTINFPFTNAQRPHCGVLAIHGCDDQKPDAPDRIRLSNIRQVLYGESHTIVIKDEILQSYLRTKSCKIFSNNYTLPPSSPLGSARVMNNNTTLFRCNHSLNVTLHQNFYNYSKCPVYNIIYDHGPPIGNPRASSGQALLTPRSKIQLSRKDESDTTTTNDPFSFLSDEIFMEVQLSDDCRKCIDRERGQCQLDSQGKFYCAEGSRRWVVKKMGLALGLALPVTIALVMATLYYTRWKKQNPTHLLVDSFLERHGHIQIKRYSYPKVKKVTISFKNKLGQGGLGSVYKGQLQDGYQVAVKLLSELKSDGEEFINEVANMSRTSHVNIVALLGFCFEDSKQALIYEFMPNRSLEKLIFEENDVTVDRQLDCQTLYDIAIGVARGLEYLHRGCSTRILHFDIKSHNILLDENFCPKISDFGLAKVCTRKESTVSIFGARGTAGYIAPEVFSRNFGVVSHKSDVYSYGMMVLEMVGRRKNIKAEVDVFSEIYFPHWIYNHLVSNQELGLRSISNECDNEKVRKMTIVSLWCIQTNPSSRPPISKVVEMLEGRVKSLQLPPKPFWFSPSTSP